MKLGNPPYGKIATLSILAVLAILSIMITLTILATVILYSSTWEDMITALEFVRKALTVAIAVVLVASTVFLYREHRRASREKNTEKTAQIRQSFFTVIVAGGVVLTINILL